MAKIIKQDMSNLRLSKVDKKKCTLDYVFYLQKKFEKIFIDFDSLTDKDKVHWTKEFVLCIQQELAELVEELPWKHWKKYDDYKIDIKNLRYELVDILHFYVCLCLLWGLDSNTLIRMYISKNKLNQRRQKDSKYGYLGKRRKKK